MKTRKTIAFALVMVLVLAALCGCMKFNVAATFRADGSTVETAVSMYYGESYFTYTETTPEAFFAGLEPPIPMDQVKTKTIDGELYYGVEDVYTSTVEEMKTESLPISANTGTEMDDSVEMKYDLFEQDGKELIRLVMTVKGDPDSDAETIEMLTSMIEMNVTYTFENGLKSATADDMSVLAVSGNSVTVDAYPREKDNTITIIGILGDAEKSLVSDPKKPVFSDVAMTAYYADAVAWAYENNVTAGYTDGTFRPENTCDRGQVVTFLWNAAGKPEPQTTANPFADVKESDYFYKAVLWAVENGITSGTSATTFNPTGPCQNTHILTFLWNSQGKPGATEAYAGKQWYDDAANWAKTAGLLEGVPGTENLTAPCPRKNIVTFMYRNAE